VLRLEGVARRRGGFRLEVPRLAVAAGERVAIVGPSGSGKSTLLDLIALTLAPDIAGRLDVAGVDAAARWRAGDRRGLAAVRARALGIVLQTGGLLSFASVRDNLLLSRRLLRMGGLGSVADWSRRLGIDHLMARRAAGLSIGERQRVAVIRALAHGPALVLADEPTAALDRDNAWAVMELFCSLVAETGATLVMVTHDAPLAERFGMRPITCRPVAGGAVIDG
jgi:putative ABC transport system ATP-binding protein